MFDGTKIKAIRLARGMQRKELSLLAQMPLRTLEEWESGEAEINKVSHLIKIAEILNSSILDFCTDEVIQNDERIKNDRISTETLLSVKELKLIEDLLTKHLNRALNNDNRKNATDLLNKIKTAKTLNKLVNTYQRR